MYSTSYKYYFILCMLSQLHILQMLLHMACAATWEVSLRGHWLLSVAAVVVAAVLDGSEK